MNWLKYSGASVSVTLNPYHWAWLPVIAQEITNEWPSPNERSYYARFLFVTVRVWVDDGSW